MFINLFIFLFSFQEDFLNEQYYLKIDGSVAQPGQSTGLLRRNRKITEVAENPNFPASMRIYSRKFARTKTGDIQGSWVQIPSGPFTLGIIFKL